MDPPLWLPEQLRLDAASTALIDDVEQTARKVYELRPLPPEIVQRIVDSLLGERVYSSNAIEGSTLDLRETVAVLRQGIAASSKKREATEARNLGDAIKLVTSFVGQGAACHSLDSLLKTHAIVLKDVRNEIAGRLRDERVMLAGAKHQPPDSTVVPSLVERVMTHLATARGKPSLALAVWAHWALARIHPFMDGNGRTARLWQDLLLFQGGLTCAIIRPEDRRNNYLPALETADEGDLNPLVQLTAHRVLDTLDKYVAEIAHQAAADVELRELVAEADEQDTQAKHLSYQRWSRRMEQVRFEFQVAVAKISELSKSFQVQMREDPLIDFAQWENIRSGMAVSRTSLFMLEFIRNRKRLRYRFFFGKHFWNDSNDTPADRAENRVCLLISEAEGSAKAVLLYQLEAPPTRLREIFVGGDDKLVVIRASSDVDGEYERGAEPRAVVMEFLRDIINNRLS